MPARQAELLLDELAELADRLGLEMTNGNFCKTDTFDPVATSKKGIYVCGAFQGPKDIPQSVVDASAAAAAAGEILSPARHTETKTPDRQTQPRLVRRNVKQPVTIARVFGPENIIPVRRITRLVNRIQFNIAVGLYTHFLFVLIAGKHRQTECRYKNYNQ